ncbi:MAG: hypothetical protein II599_08125, partial [Bacteroidales bacterium]|nr:hypothetical protein [Bacteroidales bacterium]
MCGCTPEVVYSIFDAGVPDVPLLGTWGAKKRVKRARRPPFWDERRTSPAQVRACEAGAEI